MAQPSVKLFILQGSQFCIKAMCALDSRKLAYTTVDVPLTSRAARRKVLPSGGHMVPEMLLHAAADPQADPEIVPDSTAILRRIDELVSADYEALFPSPEVAEAERHISGTINALVLYWNHVSDAGWARSIREKAASFVPAVVRPFVPYAYLMKSTRASFRAQCADTLAVSSDGDRDLNDRQMTKRLVYELARYEALLEENRPYLFNTALPSAADCSLYAMMSRFVGESFPLPPALPSLWEEEGLKNLQVWYANMEKEYPIVWKRVAEEQGEKKLARG